jgi:myo-inositol-1(or 4)-monophosphatase
VSDAASLLDLAESVAREAGQLLLERFRRPATGVGSKSSATDPVSDADRDAESLIRRRLLGARPDDSLLGEEGSSVDGRSGIRWVVDPLDGTVNYLFGIPDWAVSVACEDADGTLVGVVHIPTRGETFTAARRDGARLDGEPIAVSRADELASALIATGFSYVAEVRRAQAAALADILPRVRDIRRAGSAAVDLASVACGRVDGFYEVGLNPWDLAAGALLVREAGGLVTRDVVASGPALHEPLAALAAGALAAKNSLH